jgi:membrane-associated phospholipid phosphatase
MNSDPLKLRERLCLAALPILWMMGGYCATQHFAWRPVWWIEESAFDQAIPFDPRAVWIYGTFHAWFFLPFLALDNRALLRRYARAFFCVASVSIAIFIIIPNGVARPSVTGEIPWPYRLALVLDPPRNGFPSLHGSITVLAAAFLHRAAGSLQWPAAVRLAIWIWVAAIAWSCIALRQHVTIDMLAGCALGAAAAFFALRGPFPAGDNIRIREQVPLWE